MPGEFYQKGKAEKVDIKGILDRLDHAGYGLAALKAFIDALEGKLDNGTYGLAAMQALLDTLALNGDAIKSQTDKTTGQAPVTGSTTANWQTAESDVVTLGSDGVKFKLHSLLVSIHNLVGMVITVRMYMKVNGTVRKVYDQPFDATTDPPGLWIVNGTVGIHDAVRVTLQSNNAADNDKAVDYDYMLEAM